MSVSGVAAVIVNWHSEAQTLWLVGAMRGWTKLSPEIVVVDNESTDASRALLLQALRPNELLPSETNLGYGGGNNLGVKRALQGKARVLLLMNPDAEIAEEAAMKLVERMDGNADIGILGPVIHETQGGKQRSYIGGRDISRGLYTRIPADEATLASGPGHALVDVDYVPGAVFLARREAFERVGLFDENFFFSGETADFCKRARDMGYRSSIDLEVAARHQVELTPDATRETLYAYYSLRNRILYGRKHDPARLASHLTYWSGMCMLELGRAIMRGKLGRARAILIALAHGYTNRTGNQNAVFV